MAQRPILNLIVLFLGFSYVISCAAVPTTRSMMKSTKEDSSVQEQLVQGAAELAAAAAEMFDEVEDVEGGFIERREMYIESLDYQGSSANHQHDPKTPGTGRP